MCERGAEDFILLSNNLFIPILPEAGLCSTTELVKTSLVAQTDKTALSLQDVCPQLFLFQLWKFVFFTFI